MIGGKSPRDLAILRNRRSFCSEYTGSIYWSHVNDDEKALEILLSLLLEYSKRSRLCNSDNIHSLYLALLWGNTSFVSILMQKRYLSILVNWILNGIGDSKVFRQHKILTDNGSIGNRSIQRRLHYLSCMRNILLAPHPLMPSAHAPYFGESPIRCNCKSLCRVKCP